MAGERRRITVINQSEEFLELIDVLLEEEGPYRVTTQRVEAASTDTIVASRPDLVIVDVTAGASSPGTLLEQLLGDPRLSSAPLVLTTPATALEADQPAGIRDHPRVSVLPKPFTAVALQELVARLLPPVAAGPEM